MVLLTKRERIYTDEKSVVTNGGETEDGWKNVKEIFTHSLYCNLWVEKDAVGKVTYKLTMLFTENRLQERDFLEEWFRSLGYKCSREPDCVLVVDDVKPLMDAGRLNFKNAKVSVDYTKCSDYKK